MSKNPNWEQSHFNHLDTFIQNRFRTESKVDQIRIWTESKVVQNRIRTESKVVQNQIWTESKLYFMLGPEGVVQSIELEIFFSRFFRETGKITTG